MSNFKDFLKETAIQEFEYILCIIREYRGKLKPHLSSFSI